MYIAENNYYTTYMYSPTTEKLVKSERRTSCWHRQNNVKTEGLRRSCHTRTVLD